MNITVIHESHIVAVNCYWIFDVRWYKLFFCVGYDNTTNSVKVLMD